MKPGQTKLSLENIRKISERAPFKWMPQIVLILGALNLLLGIIMLAAGDTTFSVIFAFSAIVYLTFGFFIKKGSKTAVKILFYLILFDTFYLLANQGINALAGIRLILIFMLYLKIIEYKLEKRLEQGK